MVSNIDRFYDLRLYVYGKTEKSESAIRSVKRICATQPPGHCNFEIIDLSETPELGQQDCILATPTLIRRKPPPEQRIIGDLSETAKVLLSLGIEPG